MTSSISPPKSMRLAALRFHLLTTADRRWLLRQLSMDEQRRLTSAYKVLCRMKDFQHLDYEAISQTLKQIESAPAVMGAEANVANPVVPKLSPDSLKRILSLPDEYLAVVMAERLIDTDELLAADAKPSRKRILQQLVQQQGTPLVAPVREFLAGYLRRG